MDLNSISTRVDHGIVSLSIDVKGDNFLIGTRSAEIYYGKIGTLPEKIMDSHFEGELWGCAPDPSSKKGQSRFATCGGDKTVRIWDIVSRKMVASTE